MTAERGVQAWLSATLALLPCFMGHRQKPTDLPRSPRRSGAATTMSAVRRFSLAIMTIFILGMIIQDPEAANRPVELREASLGYGVVAAIEE